MKSGNLVNLHIQRKELGTQHVKFTIYRKTVSLKVMPDVFVKLGTFINVPY
jgi:hypothetical protein